MVLDSGRRLLGQRGRRVAIIREVTKRLARTARRALMHARLTWHLRWHLGWHLRKMCRWVLRDILWRMVRRQGVVRPLTAHPVAGPSHIRLLRRNRRAIATVRQMRRPDLRASVRRTDSIRGQRRLPWTHSTAWNERLRLRVESMTVVTTWNGMLALRIMRIDIHRQLSIRVRNAVQRCHVTLGLRCLCRTILVRARRRCLVDARLPRLWRRRRWRRCLDRWSICSYRAVG